MAGPSVARVSVPLRLGEAAQVAKGLAILASAAAVTVAGGAWAGDATSLAPMLAVAGVVLAIGSRWAPGRAGSGLFLVAAGVVLAAPFTIASAGTSWMAFLYLGVPALAVVLRRTPAVQVVAALALLAWGGQDLSLPSRAVVAGLGFAAALPVVAGTRGAWRAWAGVSAAAAVVGANL